MPLWPIEVPALGQLPFRKMPPREILLDFNGASTFTFQDDSGRLFLAHLCDDEGDTARYFVAPTNDRVLLQLRAGELSIRGALDQPLAWVVDLSQSHVRRAWVATVDSLPLDALPRPDVMLRPELDLLHAQRVT